MLLLIVRKTKYRGVVMKFFVRTQLLKELEILQHIKYNPHCTQKELSSLVNATVSMINKYIEILEKDGYLLREYISRKVVYYNITDKGKQRLNFLAISYTKELIDLYSLAKENAERLLRLLYKTGIKRVLLYGAGEVAETVINVLRDMDESRLEIVAIIDDDENKKGTLIMGYPVIGPEMINNYVVEGILITTYVYEEIVMNKLKKMGYDMKTVKRFFGPSVSKY